MKQTLGEREKDTLRNGKFGKKVTSRKQALTLYLSEAPKAGAKLPKKKQGYGLRPLVDSR